MATTPFRIELPDGHYVVGDERPGDGPAYVFLHGLASVRVGHKSGSLLAHAMARGRRFVRFDMRGHGESSGRLGRVAVSELIADVVRVLDRTGPANLVGSSLGGLVATHVAAARPDLVARLALLAPAFGLMPNLHHHLDEQGRIWTTEGEAFAVDPAVIEDARNLDEASLPRRLATPTLLVHGSDDDVIPPTVSERFHAAMCAAGRPAELWLVAGGDHRLNDVAEEIWRRLDRLPAA